MRHHSKQGRILIPFKLYYDGAYYLGFCPFKIVSSDATSVKNTTFTTKRYWLHTIYSAVVCLGITFIVTGYAAFLMEKIMRRPKGPVKFFESGVLVFHTIAILLHLHQFWFNEAAILNLVNFINDPKNVLPDQAVDHGQTKVLRFVNFSYIVGIVLATIVQPGLLGTVGEEHFGPLLKTYFQQALNSNPTLDIIFSIFLYLVELETYVIFVPTNLKLMNIMGHKI